MAESMMGLKRTCRCAEVTEEMIGSTVTLMGWTQKRRNLGSLIFVDLRDRSGLMQILFDETSVGSDGFAKAATIRNEYVLAVTGVVQRRGGAGNEKLKTGTMELMATQLRILSESETPPFPVEENVQTKEELRLKNRTLDLRRPDIQRNLMVKSQVAQLAREFMAREGFLEIETPMLGKSTPEGARDYLVPSRIYPGKFFALPQSPQLYKQLLMVAGYDRYFQLARCFRDEDLRADRQPEFTQMDMELSFVDIDDVLDVSKSFQSVALDKIRQCVDLLAGHVSLSLNIDAADRTSVLHAVRKYAEAAVFHKFRYIDQFHAEAKIRLVGAEAVHCLGPLHAAERNLYLYAEHFLPEILEQSLIYIQDIIDIHK